eukprot:SAG31_NODE_933_length_10897_cov_15.489442_3_plen_156_part_00
MHSGLYVCRSHWSQQVDPSGGRRILTSSPAGTIIVTDYPILHRRAASHVPCQRNLLKYMYWRTAPPERDWVGSSMPFDFGRANYHSPHAGAVMGDCELVARRFFWLCGRPFPTKLLGAQGWPLSRPNSVDAPWGSPDSHPPVAVVQSDHVPFSRL